MNYCGEILHELLIDRLGTRYAYVGEELIRKYGGNHILRPGGCESIARYAVHHTAGNRQCGAECLWRFFVQRRWARFSPRTGGYHAVITPDGALRMMIPPSCISWGAGPRWNNTTVHVALAGNYVRTSPTPEALQTLYTWLCSCDDALGYAPWRGHRELSQTTCPGDGVMPHLETMRGKEYGAAPDYGRKRPKRYP